MKRVVVTGIGAITPLGTNVESSWEKVKAGECGLNPISSFDTENFEVKVAGEVKDFDVTTYMKKKEAKKLDRFIHFAMAAGKEAMIDSDLDLATIDAEEFGVILGSGVGGLTAIYQESLLLEEKGDKRVSPFFIPKSIINIAPGKLAIEYGAKGQCYGVVTACASGTDAVGQAFKAIHYGEQSLVLTGGTEASINKLAIAGFNQMTALSRSTDPMRASIPFDAERNGFVMGEGAGILLLEELEHAKKRGAKIYGEVVGYGQTCDAFHITAPADGGEGAARAMKLAMKQAGVSAAEVGYINAHGTSTPHNDKNESMAIVSTFGPDTQVAVSSTKSMTGHLLGAAGAVEAIFCLRALQEQILPPTIGLENPGEFCTLDYVPGKARKAKIQYAMSNSLGFGGHNGSLLFKRWEEN
ncbi:beta-ketoacyl-ACP synthase II [Gottschalkiaceae bacterium SANA]|nr:beta-ketoacyl-ACP synthase II [Gottschalkiaceae bacterium SANA]